MLPAPPDTCYYRDLGGGLFESTPATAGPWSPSAQHGGPPAALLARELERLDPNPDQRLARLTVEILRPIPVARIAVRTRVTRPGRRVMLLEAVIESQGAECALARGWRLERSSPAAPPTPPVLPPVRDQAVPRADAWTGAHTGGYLSTIDAHLTSGRFANDGPTSAWMRVMVDLVEGEPMTALQRAIAVSDSGSGLSQGVDIGRFSAVNVELTFSAHRQPEGEWTHLASNTLVGPDGIARADTVLSDAAGDFARALQTLVVSAR